MKRITLLCILLLLCIVPVMGQDATAEPTNQVVEVIDGEGEEPPSVTCEEGSTCVVETGEGETKENETPVDNSPMGWITLGLGVLVTIIASVSLGLQVLGNRARTISNDPSAVSLLERGYDNNLPETVKMIVKPLQESLERSDEALRDMITLVRKITDGVPESSKVNNTTTSSGGYTSTVPPQP